MKEQYFEHKAQQEAFTHYSDGGGHKIRSEFHTQLRKDQQRDMKRNSRRVSRDGK